MNYKYLDLFLENTFLIEDVIGAKANNITIKFSALASTLINKKLTKELLQDKLSLINISTDINSIFRGDHYLILGTLLSLIDGDKTILTKILDFFDSLEVDFPSSNFLALTSELLCFYDDSLSHENTVEKIRYTYSLLKDKHWFLTSSEDIVTCGLIVFLYKNIPFKVEEIEKCYKNLESIKFFPSDNLQLLSEILSFSEKGTSEKTLFVARLKDFLVNSNIFIKEKSLPLLGFSALLIDNTANYIDTFKEIDLELKTDTRFKTFSLNEDLRYIISSCLTLLTLTDSCQDRDFSLKIISIYVLTISIRETNSLLGKLASRILVD